MEVKDILDKIRHQEEEKKELIFALEIGLDVIKSAVWLVEKGNIKIVSVGDYESWEKEEEIISAVDACLSSAVENIPSELELKEPNKVIFGLPSDWVEEEKIVPDKIKLLKSFSQELGLEPVGFVVTTEAIIHYLKAVEGIPPTAILIGFSKSKVSLTLVRLGKMSEPQIIKRSDNLGSDVIEGLSRYEEKEPFPARILLYDSENKLEEAKQELLDYAWQEDKVQVREVLFLHLPKIEILAGGFDIKAVALAGGREVAKAAGIEADFIQDQKQLETSLPEDEGEDVKGEISLSADEFGFLKGEDILEKEPLEKEEEPIGEVPQTLPLQAKEAETIDPKAFSSEPESPIIRRKKVFPISFNFSRLKSVSFSRLFPFFSRFSSVFGFQKKSSLIIGIVAIFLLIFTVVVGALYWYLPRASVVLLVEPRKLEEQFEVKLDPSLSAPDKDKLILPARTIEVIIDGEKSTDTTGTKMIGEKATGTVTIFNGTPQTKAFVAGTLITSASGLKFTLNEGVEVASRSSVLEPPGKASVNVTAEQIGNEGNLASGTEFNIANYSKSDYAAQNDAAFSGGTSREVQVVTDKDQQRLLTELTQQLQDQSLDRLRAEIPPNQKLLEESVKSTVEDKFFDKKTDEEANQVKLSLKLKFNALAYSEEEMKNLLDEIAEKKIPDGFEFRPEESQTEFTFNDVLPNGEARFSVKLSANLIPQLDLEKIKNDIKGKYPPLGKTYLGNLPGVVASEIKISPSLPERILTFPRQAKNIKIEIKVK